MAVDPVEISVVIPCLNEEATVSICIRKAIASFERMKVSGQVVVVDNEIPPDPFAFVSNGKEAPSPIVRGSKSP